MATSYLCKEILHCIKISSDIELCWSENKDIFKHTTIVLKFDEIPLFTIDYGPEGGYSDSSGSNVLPLNPSAAPSDKVLGASLQSSAVVGAFLIPGSDLRVNGIKFSEIGAVHSIAKFLLNSFEREKIAIQLMMNIAEIKMGKYDVWENNCRDCVKKVIKIVTETALKQFFDDPTSEQDPDKVTVNAISGHDELEKIKERDILTGSGVIATGVTLGLAALQYLAKSYFSSKE